MESCNRPEGMRIPLVPLPMALFGMVVHFMFGVAFGMLLASRKQEIMHGGHGGMGMHGGMRHHHHHGEGSPACCDQHSEWPKLDVPPIEP